MRVEISREDQNVVDVDDHIAVSNFDCEDLVHHCLECRGRVRKTEEHNERFKETAVRQECSFELIAFLNPNVVITPANVKFSVELGVREFIDQLGYER